LDPSSLTRRSPAAPDREYARLAPDYDRRWHGYVRASVAETVRHLKPAPGDRLLDLGCGTAALLETVLARMPEVQIIGLDRSMPMLHVARERLGSGTGLIGASAESLPFADHSFDWVVSSSVFHYLRQPDVTLAEIHRVLKPSGQLIITDWCRDFLTMRALHGWLSWTNRGHFRTWTCGELTDRLVRAGFEPTLSRRYRINWFWGLMTLVAGPRQAHTDSAGSAR